MVWALVLVPLLAGTVIALGRPGLRGPNAEPGPNAMTGRIGRGVARLRIAGVAALGATLALGIAASAGQASAAWRWGGSLSITARVDGISRLMVVVVPAVALAVVAYAASSMAGDTGLSRLLGLLVAFVGAMELLVVAADFLTLLVAWELVGAASWALIGHDWRRPEVTTAAAQAFVVTRVGDLGLFLAAGAALAARHSLDFAALGRPGGGTLDVVAAGVLLAAAAKSAQLPFSPWLFSAMAGPTPVSALLHSATMVAAGAYLVAKLGPALDVTGWFLPAVAAVGLATALAGGVVALVQTDLKKALAASTSAQYGLVFVAVGAGSTAAAAGHLLTHAGFKSLLFLAAGVMIHRTGTGDLTRLGPIGDRTLAVLFGIGALALAAVPPLGGGASKEAVVAAALNDSAWLGAGALVAGLLSALYAGRLYLLAFAPTSLTPEPVRSRLVPTGPNLTRTAGWEPAAMGLLAAATVALSVLWLEPGRRLLDRTTGGALPHGGAGALATSVAVLAVAAVGLWGLRRRGTLATLGLCPVRQRRLGDWLGIPVLGRRLVTDPVLALARFLAAVDDRVVDAGVRAAAAAIAAGASRALSWWAERRVDDLVWGVAAGALAAGRVSSQADEAVVDHAVEGLAGGVGAAGRLSRRLQTGLSHHYYVVVAVGILAVGVIAALGRS